MGNVKIRTMDRINRFLSFVALVLFGVTLMAQNSYNVGDVIVFPDGSKGVVCHVDAKNNKKGWAVKDSGGFTAPLF